MRIAALFFGLGLLVATAVWFFYLVPLGCAMNTTGCGERFTVWSGTGLVHFWTPLLVARSAMAYGAGRS
ncbi:hypothetical protein DK427_07870 [Methylobacterium radiodurans]|uniref:Uncharacterized protein n=2 Tax=Methylobacterium radiodurans TaxID=2202828 RepID=A0A2U8W0Y7_9HYPH|nr:hypothetical protein DK427_07870 [Methylobacterium radiodurans]